MDEHTLVDLPEGMEKVSVTISRRTAERAFHFLNFLMPKLHKIRLCYDSEVLIENLAKIEERRKKLNSLLRKAKYDDGRLLATCFLLARSMEHYLLALVWLKKDNPVAAWTNLVDAVARVRQAKASYIPPEVSDIIIGYEQRLELLMESAFPKPSHQSVSYEVLGDECSICKRPMLECDHIPGQFYGGRFCDRIIKGAKIREISLVDHPNDRGCIATELVEGNTEINLYTGREAKVDEKDENSELSGARLKGIMFRAREGSEPTTWEPLIRPD